MSDKSLRVLDVFISSPGDVKAEREIVKKMLAKLNTMPHINSRYVLKAMAWEDTTPPVMGDNPQKIVDKYMMQAEHSDIFICILWNRMGTPVKDEATGEDYESGTHYEFEHAYRALQMSKALPVMLLYRGKKPPPPNVDQAQADKVQAFFKKVESQTYQGLYQAYASDDEFERLLENHLLRVLEQDFPAQSATPTPIFPRGRRDFYAHVHMPPNYVARPELMEEIKAAVLTDAPNVALTSAVQTQAKNSPTALHGMGGIGKSVMARALCDDAAVQAAFPDGILWATLGQEPNLKEKLRVWVMELGGTISETAPSEDSLKAKLGGLLQDRACLLIVDNVWEDNDLKHFQVAGARCRLIMTTRNEGIARRVGAIIHKVPLMTQTEAIELLNQWAGSASQNISDALKVEIVERLGRLPLAVKLAGGRLQESPAEEWIADFDSLRDLDAEWKTDDPEKSVWVSFQISLKVLKEDARQLYLALGIFRENEATPENAIAKLWQELENLPAKDTSRLLSDLAAKALLELNVSPTRAVLFHDLLKMFIHSELGENEQFHHNKLLNAYRKTQKGAGWHTAEDDGYLYDHLVYHLLNSDKLHEAYELFLSPQWMNVRFEQQNFLHDGYIEDIQVLSAAIPEVKGNFEASLTQLIRLALIKSSLTSITANYPPELLGKLLKYSVWTSARCMSVLSRITDRKQRSRAAASILAVGKLNENESKITQEIALRAIEEETSERIKLLKELIPFLSESNRIQAIELWLNAASQIPSHFFRTEALFSLIEWIDEENPFAEEYARMIHDLPRGYFDFMILLNDVNKGEIVDPRVVVLAEQIINSIPADYYDEVLGRQFMYIQGKMWARMMGGYALEALDSIENFTQSFDKTAGLHNDFQRQLIHDLDELESEDTEEFNRLAQLALSIADEGEIVQLLAGIIPLLPDRERPRIIQAALALLEKAGTRLQQIKTPTRYYWQLLLMWATLLPYQEEIQRVQFIDALIEDSESIESVLHEDNIFAVIADQMSEVQVKSATTALIEITSPYGLPPFWPQAINSLIRRLNEINADKDEIDRLIQAALIRLDNTLSEVQVDTNNPDERLGLIFLRGPLLKFMKLTERDALIDDVIKFIEQNPLMLKLSRIDETALETDAFRNFVSTLISQDTYDEEKQIELLSHLVPFIDESQLETVIDIACTAPISFDRLILLVNLLKRCGSHEQMLANARENLLAHIAKLTVNRDIEREHFLKMLYSFPILKPPLLSTETILSLVNDIMDVCINWEWQ